MKISRTIIMLIAMLLSSMTAVAQSDPIFAGVWSQKEGNSLGGGLFIDQSWEGLVSHWKELGAKQYLADVEVYRQDGQWRYAGLWRVGSGNGALFILGWEEFVRQRNELKATQELVDIEIFRTGADWKFLGVWRQKQGPRRGSAGSNGAFFAGLTWDQLVARWNELGKDQYLAKVETYIDNGKRLYAGVWRVGTGNGALYLMNDWSQFAEKKRSLDATQEMLDFEMFQNDEGQWSFLGVWRNSGRKAGPLHASINDERFRPSRADDFLERVNKTRPKHTLVDIAVAVPVIVMKGDTACKYGDVDCNRCADNVTGQFRAAFAKGFSGGSWTFNGQTKYPPDNFQPEDAFKLWDTGLPSKHIQGLVRTNSDTYPYAGSHSHKTQGSIFFIRADKNGGKSLFSLHRSLDDHPSGVHVLGDGLYVAERKDGIDYLRSFGVFSSIDDQNTRFTFPKIDPRRKGLQGAGGGLGLAKLVDGGYLLVVTAPGDGFRPGTTIDGLEENLEPRYTRFYRIVGSLHPGLPEKRKDGSLNITFLGEWKHEGSSKHPDTPMAYSENLSVVTECGTGHIYTIHTTGQYLFDGDGYWRLSRIEGGADPRLRFISMMRQSQDNKDCHHRSSATVHVSKTGELEFLCTERTVSDRKGAGRFNFKEGKP